LLNADKHKMNINHRRSRNRDPKEEEEKGEESGGDACSRPSRGEGVE